MVEFIVMLLIGYLKLSLVCAPFMAIFAYYDTRMHPMCHGCGNNHHTSRPKFWSQWTFCSRCDTLNIDN